MTWSRVNFAFTFIIIISCYGCKTWSLTLWEEDRLRVELYRAATLVYHKLMQSFLGLRWLS